MLDQAEYPSGWEIRGDLVCLLCARSVASAQGPADQRFAPSTIRVRLPEYTESVRRMRCPFCAGRLWLQDTEDVYVDRRPLDAQDLRPRRGRPPKLANAS